MPSSGSRSGTRPSRAGRGAGDGSAGKKVLLRCGCEIPAEQEPLAASGGKRFYACPEHGLSERRT